MIIVNDRPMPWHQGMTAADVIQAYNQYDSLIYLNPELMIIIDGKSYSDEEASSFPVQDGARIILMYEFWGG